MENTSGTQDWCDTVQSTGSSYLATVFSTGLETYTCKGVIPRCMLLSICSGDMFLSSQKMTIELNVRPVYLRRLTLEPATTSI